jgi:hypothetical protein
MAIFKIDFSYQALSLDHYNRQTVCLDLILSFMPLSRDLGMNETV